MSHLRITLPAPHESVQCWARSYGWGAWVEYVAPTVEAAIAAGRLAGYDMTDLAKHPKSRDRRDDSGDKIYCKSHPSKAHPQRSVIHRYITDTDRAIELPGVRKALKHSKWIPPKSKRGPRTGASYQGTLNAPSTAQRLPWLNTAADAASRCLGPDSPVTERSRSLGRRQRPVTWATVGDLVVIPNWLGIRSAVEAARG